MTILYEKMGFSLKTRNGVRFKQSLMLSNCVQFLKIIPGFS
jgi:hypothetical protein